MNNWQKKGFNSMEEGIVYVLGYLKENEERLMSHSVSDEAVITCGELVLHLNQKTKKKNGKEKK